MDEHPDEELLLRYTAGRATPDEVVAVDAHLASCESCVAQVRALDRLRADLETSLATFSLVEHKRLAAEAAAHAPRETEKPLPSRRVPLRPWMLGAAAAAIVAVLVWFSTQRHATLPDGVLRDGSGWARLTDAGEVQFSAISEVDPAWAQRIRAAWASGAIEPLAFVQQALADPAGALLNAGEGDSDRPQILRPRGSILRPGACVVRWRVAPNTRGQRVVVSCDPFPESIVELAAPDVDTLTLPASALHPGRRHVLQVEADTANGVRLSTPAAFFVLGEETSAALAALEQDFAGSDLALAVVYASHGLVYDARAALTRLRDANPGDARVEAWLTTLEARAH